MATLYVENVPDDLYDSLRERARQHRKSIAAEVLALLEQNVVTPAERKARESFLRQVKRLRARKPGAAGPFSSSEEMQREDRAR
jgi:plasmid stability protein